MNKTDMKTKEIRKSYVDAYTKNMETRWDEISTELLKVDNEIKTKNDKLIQALKDLKSKKIRLKEVKELENKKLIHA
jgi:dihydroxyacetone kinase DhaKLM complex PTS-EIIA-like component DhaM